ncbi:MAG: hypothetical protein ACE5HQ_00905 [Gemmatimonadota bacterium]
MTEKRARHVLISQPERSSRRRPSDDQALLSSVLAWLGAAFLIVGLTDLLLLWIPVHFESVAWEFATVGRSLDGLPMVALGAGLLAYGGGWWHAENTLRSLVPSLGFLVLALLLVGLAVLFATSAPAVLKSTPSEAIEGARRATIRHAVQAVTYPAVFAVISAVLWRAARPRER